jgi:hypothetical protein
MEENLSCCHDCMSFPTHETCVKPNLGNDFWRLQKHFLLHDENKSK